jgi:energy-coupling factor transporter ATP-binding protein EcfA2
MALLIEGATYRYAGSGRSVLRGVDLRLERGQVVGVVGPNGAGKSTLGLVAVGLAPGVIGGELSGTVTIDGLATAATPMHQLAQHVGILFQEPETQLSGAAPTVWEEVSFGPRNLALSLAEVVERTWSAIDALGIGELVERDPGRLSGGQAQLVALAGVLALRPAYLVLDEPTSQLDPRGTQLVVDALERTARASDAGILIVEHKTDLLARLCDEVIALADGAVVKRGAAAVLLADPLLPELGVAQPPPIRLRRAVEAAGGTWDDRWA